jgi:hypothetical protein
VKQKFPAVRKAQNSFNSWEWPRVEFSPRTRSYSLVPTLVLAVPSFVKQLVPFPPVCNWNYDHIPRLLDQLTSQPFTSSPKKYLLNNTLRYTIVSSHFLLPSLRALCIGPFRPHLWVSPTVLLYLLILFFRVAWNLGDPSARKSELSAISNWVTAPQKQIGTTKDYNFNLIILLPCSRN